MNDQIKQDKEMIATIIGGNMGFASKKVVEDIYDFISSKLNQVRKETAESLKEYFKAKDKEAFDQVIPVQMQNVVNVSYKSDFDAWCDEFIKSIEEHE
jgi:hypothetical protein